jgi:hypothetical protein
MSEPGLVTRTVYVLHRGARVCFLLAVLLLLLAGYWLFAPIDVPVQGQPMFRCGSAIQPPSGDLAKSVCGRIYQDRQLRAGLVAGAALVTAVGGLFAFGGTRRTVEVVQRAEPPADHAPEQAPDEPDQDDLEPDDLAGDYRPPDYRPPDYYRAAEYRSAGDQAPDYRAPN